MNLPFRASLLNGAYRTHVAEIPMLKLACALVLLFDSMSARSQSVTFHEGEDKLDISIDGKPFATYMYQDAAIPRPYFCSVKAPNGVQVTRRHPPDPLINKNNDDHPDYHPGIWLAFGDIGGVDVWRNKGRVRHVRFLDEPHEGEGTGVFSVENAYESGDQPPRTVCRETCTYTIRATPRGYWLLSQSDFYSNKRDFTFGDQEEMGLGVRMATRFTVKLGNGAIVNSDGGENEEGTWGKEALWCAYYGIEDGQRVGITIMPDPANFRRSWFHSRDYGLLVANPFGKKAMTAPDDNGVPLDSTPVKQGEHFRLDFGVLVFSEPDSTPLDGQGDYDAFLGLLSRTGDKE